MLLHPAPIWIVFGASSNWMWISKLVLFSLMQWVSCPSRALWSVDQLIMLQTYFKASHSSKAMSVPRWSSTMIFKMWRAHAMQQVSCFSRALWSIDQLIILQRYFKASHSGKAVSVLHWLSNHTDNIDSSQEGCQGKWLKIYKIWQIHLLDLTSVI